MSPVPLPGPGARLEAGTEVTILGWGKEADTGGVSPDLNYVQVWCWCSYRGLFDLHTFQRWRQYLTPHVLLTTGPWARAWGVCRGPARVR